MMGGDMGGSSFAPESILLSLLLAFCLGHVIGWVYMGTHVGLSYSQMFVASLVVIPILVALTMALMSGDIVIALGLLAVFAIVRFRNVLKDTRDTTFIMWAILEGMATGTMRYGLVLISSACVAFIFMYLRLTSFGGRHRFDVVVSLQTEGPAVAELQPILRRHSLKIQVAAQRRPAGPNGRPFVSVAVAQSAPQPGAAQRAASHSWHFAGFALPSRGRSGSVKRAIGMLAQDPPGPEGRQVVAPIVRSGTRAAI